MFNVHNLIKQVIDKTAKLKHFNIIPKIQIKQKKYKKEVQSDLSDKTICLVR